LLDVHGNLLDQVFFNQKRSKDGSIIHSGDDTTGDGAGDDETIQIFLDKVHQSVDTIWPVITIYTPGKQFDDVKGAYCRLMDHDSKAEICRFYLSDNQDNISNGNIMANFKR
jgi:tellurium resistance protein TerZ